MICHGGSNPKAVMNAIFTAREFVSKKVNEKMVIQLQKQPQKKDRKFDFKFPKTN
jgi:glycerol-3-phosphate acyltransferase PlsX